MTTSQEWAERYSGFVRDDQPAPEGARLKLAQIIHSAWSATPWSLRDHPEDLVAADAVIAVFPQLASAAA